MSDNTTPQSSQTGPPEDSRLRVRWEQTIAQSRRLRESRHQAEAELGHALNAGYIAIAQLPPLHADRFDPPRPQSSSLLSREEIEPAV
ncbi:MAG TPA: hypothetical protein VFW33_11005 [Gemmataceae bacterium]|nr:hypothetical protein [Gemmataceae bacterium]